MVVVPQLIEGKNGQYVISLEAEYTINNDFYCIIIFLDLDSIVDADMLEVIPGKIYVCRDEIIFNSAIRKGIVLGVIFNDEFTE